MSQKESSIRPSTGSRGSRRNRSPSCHSRFHLNPCDLTRLGVGRARRRSVPLPPPLGLSVVRRCSTDDEERRFLVGVFRGSGAPSLPAGTSPSARGPNHPLPLAAPDPESHTVHVRPSPAYLPPRLHLPQPPPDLCRGLSWPTPAAPDPAPPHPPQDSASASAPWSGRGRRRGTEKEAGRGAVCVNVSPRVPQEACRLLPLSDSHVPVALGAPARRPDVGVATLALRLRSPRDSFRATDAGRGHRDGPRSTGRARP